MDWLHLCLIKLSLFSILSSFYLLSPISIILGFVVKCEVQWKDDVTNPLNQQSCILLEPKKHITLNPVRWALIKCAGALSTLSGSLKSLPWASCHGITVFTVVGVGAEEPILNLEGLILAAIKSAGIDFYQLSRKLKLIGSSCMQRRKGLFHK